MYNYPIRATKHYMKYLIATTIGIIIGLIVLIIMANY